MSAMSSIQVEIEERLFQGQLPEQIAHIMHVPIRWVYEVEQSIYDSQNENFSYD